MLRIQTASDFQLICLCAEIALKPSTLFKLFLYNKINKCNVLYVVKQRENVFMGFILNFEAEDKSEIIVAQKGLTADLHSTKWGKLFWNEKSSFNMKHEIFSATKELLLFNA